MKNSNLIKTILITAALPLFGGCVERQVIYRDRPVYVQQPPPAEVVVDQPSEPPPPQVEVRPIPSDPTYVWIGGVYEWRGGRWIWIGGHWDRPHPGRVWARGYVWIGAGWR